jgi:hypothetical protein
MDSLVSIAARSLQVWIEKRIWPNKQGAGQDEMTRCDAICNEEGRDVSKISPKHSIILSEVEGSGRSGCGESCGTDPSTSLRMTGGNLIETVKRASRSSRVRSWLEAKAEAND